MKKIALTKNDVEKYSSFYRNTISYIIANIMNIYEGKTFTYETFTNTTNSKLMTIITDESNKYRTDIYKAAEEGKVFILIDDEKNKKIGKIIFYTLNHNNEIEQCVNFGKFSYIKDFIDTIISYRIKNNIKNYSLTLEQLENLKDDFIHSKKDEIIDRHQQLETNKIK